MRHTQSRLKTTRPKTPNEILKRLSVAGGGGDLDLRRGALHGGQQRRGELPLQAPGGGGGARAAAPAPGQGGEEAAARAAAPGGQRGRALDRQVPSVAEEQPQRRGLRRRGGHLLEGQARRWRPPRPWPALLITR